MPELHLDIDTKSVDKRAASHTLKCWLVDERDMPIVGGRGKMNIVIDPPRGDAYTIIGDSLSDDMKGNYTVGGKYFSEDGWYSVKVSYVDVDGVQTASCRFEVK